MKHQRGHQSRLAPTAISVALGVALTGAPGWAQPIPNWRDYRDSYLSEGRHYLMAQCSRGRQVNAERISFWGDIIPEVRRRLVMDGMRIEVADAMHSGLSHAMRQFCPDVW